MPQRAVSLLALTLVLAGAVVHAGPARAGVERAQSADRFVDSIGVNVHWSYPDTPYGFAYAAVRRRLLESGIRHVRTGFDSRTVELGKLGIKTNVLADLDNNSNGGPAAISAIVARIKAVNKQAPAIDSVEGPNEPDLFWAGGHKTYNGQGFPQGVVAFQKDLYAALKADPATTKLTVIGPSLGGNYDYDRKSPYGSNGEMAPYVDWGSFHPYPFGGNPYSQHNGYDTLDWYIGHGSQPSVNLDESPFAFDVVGVAFKPKPIAATETGYSTFANGASEAVQGKYIPRLYMEYFRKGIPRTFVYEFVDEFTDPNNREARFGMLHNDSTVSPKPAYTAVKNLIALLSDKAAPPAFRPGSLNFGITVGTTTANGTTYNRTQYVHHLLFQKSTGDFYLALWHEVSDEDTSVNPHRVIQPPAMPVLITLPASIRSATQFVPNDGTAGTPLTIAGGQLHLQAPDKVVVIRLSQK